MMSVNYDSCKIFVSVCVPVPSRTFCTSCVCLYICKELYFTKELLLNEKSDITHGGLSGINTATSRTIARCGGTLQKPWRLSKPYVFKSTPWPGRRSRWRLRIYGYVTVPYSCYARGGANWTGEEQRRDFASDTTARGSILPGTAIICSRAELI